ncbi:hypothetical protein [Acinetobacter junii]|uniref:hypothetical protein n=1 Tax=Acinetobacter junii TaxID=40215 RepID=UPI001F3647C2|nr:hypothetical protein [Acinetobacter junii]MCE6003544.1 hypothetical protein [Acinetobacter junii]MDR7654551.1 hypothetical protein [Acinetobacter junii]
MAKVSFVTKEFRKNTLDLINFMNELIGSYQRQGYVLTVRQLYYQLVARDVISNDLNSYKRIAAVINDAKLAGLIDWDAIEDRTRDFIVRSSWDSVSSILDSCVRSFHMNMWQYQSNQVYVVVEKEALVGVLERTCREFDVPLLAARGYPSSSVLYDFAKRHIARKPHWKTHTIIHLGDHDPSGLDMTRDLSERIELLTGGSHHISIERIALNYDQIEELKPPKNPAKDSDSRFDSYRKRFGTSSWELDALSPEFLNNLVSSKIEEFIDYDAWENRKSEILERKSKLQEISDGFRGE